MNNGNIQKIDLLIIGSGPAGYSAAIYGARAGLKTILLEGQQPGGQLTITTDVENYPGFAEAIQGPWLMEQMKQQAINCEAEVVFDYVKAVDFSQKTFLCSAKKKYSTKTVIIATGAQAKWLGISGEEEFRGFGVSGCATCDGPFFRNKIVAVVGGGNAAVEEAIFLTNHAQKVFLIHRRDALRAEKILQNRLFKNPKIECLWNRTLIECIGSTQPKKITHMKLQDVQSKKESTHEIDGIFIAIGHNPNSKIFQNQLQMDETGYIITKPDSTETSVPGVFACGDVQDKVYRQAVTAAGTGCMAALQAAKFLEEN